MRTQLVTPKTRPNSINGITIRTKTGYGTLYLTINELDGNPFEVFTTIGKSGMSITAKTEAISRLISLALRSGVDVKEIIKQLKGIEGEHSIWADGAHVKSIPDAIAQVLEHIYLKKEAKKDEPNKGVDKRTA